MSAWYIQVMFTLGNGVPPPEIPFPVITC